MSKTQLTKVIFDNSRAIRNGVILNGKIYEWDELSSAQRLTISKKFMMPAAIKISNTRETIRRMENLYPENVVKRLTRMFRVGSKVSLKKAYAELDRCIYQR